MIVITAAYFLLMMVFSVSGFCDMDATGAIPPSEADNIPIEQCEFYIDLHGWPYYLTNPNNCSQFWECTVAGDICLFECQHCGTPSECPETGALYFNPDLQYPLGPACAWPRDIECTNPWSCPLPCQHFENGKCEPECCKDSDCKDPSKPICNADGLCQDGCRKFSDCDGSNVICHEPWAQDPNNCEYCANQIDGIGECLPGCIDTPDLCPTGFECDGNHKCQPSCKPPGCCTKGADCTDWDTTCQHPALNPPDANSPSCEYCTADFDGTPTGTCESGCDKNNNKCTGDYTICQKDHECAMPGDGTLLQKIEIKTTKCDGCSDVPDNEGGAIIKFLNTLYDPDLECTTNGLDSSKRDYYAESTATFVSGVEENTHSMGECYQAVMDLDHGATATIGWGGQAGSTWTPQAITVTIVKQSTLFVYDCTPPNGSVIDNNESSKVTVKCTFTNP